MTETPPVPEGRTATPYHGSKCHQCDDGILLDHYNDYGTYHFCESGGFDSYPHLQAEAVLYAGGELVLEAKYRLRVEALRAVNRNRIYATML